MNERIKALRKATGLTQTEFGRRIGVSRDAIAAYERNGANPTPSVLLMIVKEFNVNQEWLRDGIGEMFEPVEPETEILGWIAEAQKMPPNAIQRRMAAMMAKLSPEEWSAVDHIIELLKSHE